MTNLKKKAGVYDSNGKKIQLLEEIKGFDTYCDHMTYNGIKIFNNRYETYDQQNHKFIS